jgi:serine protease Do
VEVSATDIGVIDVPAAMTELAPAECTSAGSEAYDDPVFEGEIEFFTDCAGTGTIYVLLAATYKPEPERIALVQAQITADRDFDAIVRVLDTFNFTG